jgi:DNA-binding MurR/RpiR family transcriptional regulator
VQFADLARSRGAYVIGITNRAKSPLTAKCAVVFVASWPETPHTGGAFPSKISQLLIVDALIDAILGQAPELRAAIDDTAQSVTTRSF